MATRAGPKAKITAEPLVFHRWPLDRAKRREKFIETYLIVPRGEGAGKKVRLRDFQKEMQIGRAHV